MKAFLYTLMASGLISAAAMAGQDIAVEDLPKPVKDTIESKFSGSKLIKAEKDLKRGEVVYEVKVELKEKGRKDLTLKESGELLEMELDD